MRLLVLTGNRTLWLLLEEILPQYGLTGEVVSLPAALAARDQPSVLFHTERWDEAARATLRRLTVIKARVYVIGPDAADEGTYLAMLQNGVRDASTERSLALRVLAFKVRRDAGAQKPERWYLGTCVFVPAEACLYQEGVRIGLAPTEVRLLERLCLAVDTNPASRLTVSELAQELEAPESSLASRESSARNYITKLRRKLEEDPDHPQVLRRDVNGYWVVLRSPPTLRGH